MKLLNGISPSANFLKKRGENQSQMRSKWFSLLTVSIVVWMVELTSSLSNDRIIASIGAVTGTCRVGDSSLSLDAYYNQAAIRITNLQGRNVSGPDFDLGKNGAFISFGVMYCETSDYPGSKPTEVLAILIEKGFTVVESCNIAAQLRYGVFHVLIVLDAAYTDHLTVADIASVNTFYKLGGSLFLLTNDCPNVGNVNRLLQGLPEHPSKLQLHYNDNLFPGVTMNPGNPMNPNEFGFHVAFTGVPSITSGQMLSVPFYNGSFSQLGVYAPMATVAVTTVPTACSGEPSPIGMVSHPTVVYLDPPVQLATVDGARDWGRIVVDTGFNKYHSGEDFRTTNYRFAANIVVWLANIEKYYSNQTVAGNRSQVLSCSNGDTVSFSTLGSICLITFFPAGPSCSGLYVQDVVETICVLDLSRALMGTYWAFINGKNSSLRLAVTASSLLPRATVKAVTGATCSMLSSTWLYGCTDGDRLTIEWLLPYPSRMTLGNGSSTTPSACSSFTFTNQQVFCTLVGTTRLYRGRFQIYINGVSSGISLSLSSKVPNPNGIYCSNSRTISRSRSKEFSLTDSVTTSATLTITLSTEKSLSQSGGELSGSVTETETLSVTRSRIAVTISLSQQLSMTLTLMLSPSETFSITESFSSVSVTGTETVSQSLTLTGTFPSPTKPSLSLAITESVSWDCVNQTRLGNVLLPYVVNPPTAITYQLDVRNGTNLTVLMPPVPFLEDNVLHIPWHLPVALIARVVPSNVRNQVGFESTLWYAANVNVTFIEGIGASSTLQRIRNPRPVRISIPPLPHYRIYEEETVTLEFALSNLTLGYLCGAAWDNVKNRTVESREGAGLLRIVVFPEPNLPLDHAKAGLTPVVVVASILAPYMASSVQVILAIAISPCGNSFQTKYFGVRRALSVFTADTTTMSGMLLGNLYALAAGFVGLYIVTIAVALKMELPVHDAAIITRFPNLCLQVPWLMSYTSTVFVSLQLFHREAPTTNDYVFGAFMFAGVGLGVPALLMFFMFRRVNGQFEVYELHKWNRNRGALHIRWLAPSLLPKGRWQPLSLRRRLGPLLAMCTRPERIWILFPLVSPFAVGVLSGIPFQSLNGCHGIFASFIAVHLFLIFALWFWRPLRTGADLALHTASYAVMILYCIFSSINLQFPIYEEVEYVLMVIVVAQVALLVFHALHNVAHVFISRRFDALVPRKFVFEWFAPQSESDEDAELPQIARLRSLRDRHREDSRADTETAARALETLSSLDGLEMEHRKLARDRSSSDAASLDGILANIVARESVPDVKGEATVVGVDDVDLRKSLWNLDDYDNDNDNDVFGSFGLTERPRGERSQLL